MNEFDALFDDLEKAGKWIKERLFIVGGMVLLGILLWSVS